MNSKTNSLKNLKYLLVYTGTKAKRKKIVPPKSPPTAIHVVENWLVTNHIWHWIFPILRMESSTPSWVIALSKSMHLHLDFSIGPTLYLKWGFLPSWPLNLTLYNSTYPCTYMLLRPFPPMHVKFNKKIIKKDDLVIAAKEKES